MIRYHVLIPMRDAFEQLGALVYWDGVKQQVTTVMGSTKIQMKVGQDSALVNGQWVALDAPAIKFINRVMVPLRFLSETMGDAVSWDQEQQLVSITTNAAMSGTASNMPLTTTSVPLADSSSVPLTPPVMTGAMRSLTTISAGTVIPVRMIGGLRSDKCSRDDTFVLQVDGSSVAGYEGIPNGTYINGHVTHARASDRSAPGMLGLAFDSIRLPNNRKEEITASLIGLDAKSVLNQGGRLTAIQGRSADENLKFIGYGRGPGSIVSVPTKGAVIDDSLIGIALAKLLGATPLDPTHFHNVILPPGAMFGLRINVDLDYSLS
jgi:hypothetical protein